MEHEALTTSREASGNGEPDAEPPPTPRRVTVPPEPNDRFRVWSGLVIVLAACVAPLVVALGVGDVVAEAEARALLTSRETSERGDGGESGAWLIPTANGEPRIDTPPMTQWLHALSWWGLRGGTAGGAGGASPDVLVWRARLVSVVMGLVALAATYWAGMSLGGVRVSRVAVLGVGTMLLFIGPVREASPEPIVLGFTSLAIAAGLWAVRPLRPITWVGRRVSGWAIAGLALGAGILSAGPVAILLVLPPLLAAIALTPGRRMGNTTGLLFALFLGLILASPWYLYVLDRVPGAWDIMFGELAPPRDLLVVTWSHGWLLALLSPWQVWLLGALCLPVFGAERERRRQLLIAWFWFVSLFVVFSAPAAGDPGSLLPILPAAGLMIGQLWSYHAALASARQEAPATQLLRAAHWTLIGAASLALPLFIALQGTLIERGFLEQAELPGLGWRAALGLAGSLLGVAALGAKWHWKWRPRQAAYATAAWMLIVATVGVYAHAYSHRHVYTHREDARRVSAAVGERPLFELTGGGSAAAAGSPFAFYLNRPVRPITSAHLPDLAERPDRAAVIAGGSERRRLAMRDAGYEPGIEFSADAGRRVLYHPAGQVGER